MCSDCGESGYHAGSKHYCRADLVLALERIADVLEEKKKKEIERSTVNKIYWKFM